MGRMNGMMWMKAIQYSTCIHTCHPYMCNRQDEWYDVDEDYTVQHMYSYLSFLYVQWVG